MKRLPEPLVWDRREAAAALGVSLRCFAYWAAAGRVPGFVLMNGHPRWQRAVIQKWIRSGCPAVCKDVQTDEADILDSGDLP